MEGWLSIQDVAQKLGISVSAVHRLASRGTLAFRWLAGRRMVHRDTLTAYLSNPALQARRRAKHTLDDNGQLRLDIASNGVAEVVK